MRLPITRNDLRTALPKLARQLADLQGGRLSAAYRDLSWALGYRDLHALQQEAVPDLTPDVLCHVSGRAVNVDGLLPSAVPDTLLYTRMIWNLHRRSERPLSVCETLITRLTLDRLDLQRHTLSAQLKKRHPDRLYVLDESASLWPSDPHRLSARAVGVGAPALRWVVRRDGQVFRWSQLQHWLSLIPAGEDLTDAQLQSVVADAWAPLDRGWEDLEWTNVRVGVLQDQSYQRLGWVLHDKVQSGVFPALYPSEQAARDALLPTLTGDVQPDFSLPISLDSGKVALTVGSTVKPVPQLTVHDGQLRGLPFTANGCLLLSTLDLRKEIRRFPWRLLGLPRPPVALTPPEWDDRLQELSTVFERQANAAVTTCPDVSPTALVGLALQLASPDALLATLHADHPGEDPDPDESATSHVRKALRARSLKALPEALIRAAMPHADTCWEMDNDPQRIQQAIALQVLTCAVYGFPIWEQGDLLGTVLLGYALRCARKLTPRAVRGLLYAQAGPASRPGPPQLQAGAVLAEGKVVSLTSPGLAMVTMFNAGRSRSGGSVQVTQHLSDFQ